jgi:hypothetical protein
MPANAARNARTLIGSSSRASMERRALPFDRRHDTDHQLVPDRRHLSSAFASLPAPLLEGARDRARGPVRRVIDGGEQVDVGVLHVQAPRTQADFDLAAFCGRQSFAVDLREADDDASDSTGKSSKGESDATFDVVTQGVGDIDIALGNLNLHHVALALVA